MTSTVPSVAGTDYRRNPATVNLARGYWRKSRTRLQCSCCLRRIEPWTGHYLADDWTWLCRTCHEQADPAAGGQ